MSLATQAQLRSDRLAHAFLFLMMTSPQVRLWSGVGDLSVAPSGPDTGGGVYKGVGGMIQVPALSVPLGGTMVRIDFVVSGVSPDFTRLANADRASVRGARVYLAVQPFGGDLQPLGDPYWLWSLIADTPKMTRSGSGDGVVRTLILSCAAGETARKQQPLTRFTATDQRERSSDDAFCDRVSLYDQGRVERWPQ